MSDDEEDRVEENKEKESKWISGDEKGRDYSQAFFYLYLVKGHDDGAINSSSTAKITEIKKDFAWDEENLALLEKILACYFFDFQETAGEFNSVLRSQSYVCQFTADQLREKWTEIESSKFHQASEDGKISDITNNGNSVDTKITAEMVDSSHNKSSRQNVAGENKDRITAVAQENSTSHTAKRATPVTDFDDLD
mmetsp:Transcript_16317/g.18421  ORF Transcript_16317/g.18421 Transcript_16317/m.18421 type:complete len:195 (+) Transcript_16317:592-1176(+)